MEQEVWSVGQTHWPMEVRVLQKERVNWQDGSRKFENRGSTGCRQEHKSASDGSSYNLKAEQKHLNNGIAQMQNQVGAGVEFFERVVQNN